MTSLRFYYSKLVVYMTLDGWHFTVFRCRELDGGGGGTLEPDFTSF